MRHGNRRGRSEGFEYGDRRPYHERHHPEERRGSYRDPEREFDRSGGEWAGDMPAGGIGRRHQPFGENVYGRPGSWGREGYGWGGNEIGSLGLRARSGQGQSFDHPPPPHSERRFGKTPKGFKRSDDRIRDDLCEMIMRTHWIDASDVDVQVKDGEVILTGTIASREAKHEIEDLCDDCLGVTGCHNEIRVKRPDDPFKGTEGDSGEAEARSRAHEAREHEGRGRAAT